MSKVSLQERNKKRKKLIDKYYNKRLELKKKSKDASLSDEERFACILALDKLPLNSSPVRYRLRCSITGRGRGNFRDFAMSRTEFRRKASIGELPGITKSSW